VTIRNAEQAMTGGDEMERLTAGLRAGALTLVAADALA
jgi:hypothetical protein